MILTDLGRSLLKRWPITLVGILVTAAAAMLIVRVTPVNYHLKASIVLLPPENVVGEDGNPYLQLGGLEQALDVLVRAVEDNQVKDTIADAAPHAGYIVQRDATTSGPILVIEVTAPTEAESIDAMTILRAKIPSELEALQSDLSVSSESQVTAREIAVDTTPEVDNKDQIRMLIVVSGMGIVLTLGLVAIADRILEARRCKRESESDSLIAETE